MGIPLVIKRGSHKDREEEEVGSGGVWQCGNEDGVLVVRCPPDRGGRRVAKEVGVQTFIIVTLVLKNTSIRMYLPSGHIVKSLSY